MELARRRGFQGHRDRPWGRQPWPGGGWRRPRLACGKRASFLHNHVRYTHATSRVGRGLTYRNAFYEKKLRGEPRGEPSNPVCRRRAAERRRPSELAVDVALLDDIKLSTVSSPKSNPFQSSKFLSCHVTSRQIMSDHITSRHVTSVAPPFGSPALRNRQCPSFQASHHFMRERP